VINLVQIIILAKIQLLAVINVWIMFAEIGQEPVIIVLMKVAAIQHNIVLIISDQTLVSIANIVQIILYVKMVH